MRNYDNPRDIENMVTNGLGYLGPQPQRGESTEMDLQIHLGGLESPDYFSEAYQDLEALKVLRKNKPTQTRLITTPAEINLLLLAYSAARTEIQRNMAAVRLEQVVSEKVGIELESDYINKIELKPNYMRKMPSESGYFKGPHVKKYNNRTISKEYVCEEIQEYTCGKIK